MLRIEIDLQETVEVRKKYRETDLWHGVDLARRIEALKRTVVEMAARFSARQAVSKTIPDGRASTLEDLVFGPLARGEAPRGQAGILHGMQWAGAQSLPGQPESYVIGIHDAPGRARRFRDLKMIAVYLDPATILRIIWIGPEKDFPDVVLKLHRATRGLRDWQPLLAGHRLGWSN